MRLDGESVKSVSTTITHTRGGVLLSFNSFDCAQTDARILRHLRENANAGKAYDPVLRIEQSIELDARETSLRQFFCMDTYGARKRIQFPTLGEMAELMLEEKKCTELRACALRHRISSRDPGVTPYMVAEIADSLKRWETARNGVLAQSPIEYHKMLEYLHKELSWQIFFDREMLVYAMCEFYQLAPLCRQQIITNAFVWLTKMTDSDKHSIYEFSALCSALRNVNVTWNPNFPEKMREYYNALPRDIAKDSECILRRIDTLNDNLICWGFVQSSGS